MSKPKTEKERRCGFCSTEHHDQCSNGKEITRRDHAGEYTIVIECGCDHSW